MLGVNDFIFRYRDQWYLVLPGLLGVLVGLYVYGAVTGAGSLVPAVVAAADVPPTTRLEADMVSLVHLPTMAVHPEAMTNLADVVGKEVMVPLRAGEQILLGKLQGGNTTAGPAKDERIMFLPLDDGTAYPRELLQPGITVDLLFVSDRNSKQPLARLLLSGLPVISVFREGMGMPFSSLESVRGVGLAVTASQAERIAFALNYGSIHILFGNGNTGEIAPLGVSWENLFSPSLPLEPAAATGDSPYEEEVDFFVPLP